MDAAGAAQATDRPAEVAPIEAPPAAGSVARALHALAMPAGLVTPAAWGRLLEAGALVPLSTGGGIECRPDDPERADLAIRFLEHEAARDLTGAPLAVAGALGPPLRDLARRWRDRPARGPGQRLLWLELDLPAGAAPAASVFAGIGNPPRGVPEGAADDAEWAALVAGLAPHRSVGPVLALRALLPRTAWIGYVGIMRGGELRATVSGLAPDEIPAFLRRLGWPGAPAAAAPAALAALLRPAREQSWRLTLGLDLTDGVGAALGVEIAPFGPDGWERLCLAVDAVAPLPGPARAALLAWPGETAPQPASPGPGLPARTVVRRLNHLKFGFDGDAPPRLKAYLYYGLLE